MKTRFIVRTIIFSSSFLFVLYAIFFGDLGLKKYLVAKKNIDLARKEVDALVIKVAMLEKNIQKMKKSNAFLLEKSAREDLQMGDKGETVYLM